MTRILLTYLFPLAAPTIIYLCWVWYLRSRPRAHGDETPKIARGGLFWSFIVGTVFLFISLFTIAATSGVAPDAGKYQSPRLIDGKVVPPTYTK